MGRLRSSGQALVEFTVIVPLFFLLLFGVVEYSLINASVGTFNFAAKEAARFGAILGEAGTVVQGTVSIDTDTYIVDDIILPRVQGVVMAKGTQIKIFNSDVNGNCITTTTSNGTVVCQADTWTPSSNGTWTSSGNNWPYNQRIDSLSDADYLGIKISYTYTYVTAFFATTSPTIKLTALSVQRIEPQQYGERHAPGANALAMTTPGEESAWAPSSLASMYALLTSGYWTRRTLSRLPGGRA